MKLVASYPGPQIPKIRIDKTASVIKIHLKRQPCFMTITRIQYPFRFIQSAARRIIIPTIISRKLLSFSPHLYSDPSNSFQIFPFVQIEEITPNASLIDCARKKIQEKLISRKVNTPQSTRYPKAERFTCRISMILFRTGFSPSPIT